MNTRSTLWLLAALLLAAAFALSQGVSPAHAAPGDFTVHADWAESLARNVLPADNEYDNDPNILVWPGVNDGQKYQNRTVCGSSARASSVRPTLPRDCATRAAR